MGIIAVEPHYEVWKFALPEKLDDVVSISMPRGATILHFAMQQATACIWAVVDPKAQKINRHFRFAGTGHPLGPGVLANYVGTIRVRDGVSDSGELVFHLFDYGEV